jgi:LAO/AO transport system kinase
MGNSNIDNAKEKAVARFLNSQNHSFELDDYVNGILKGDKQILAKAITLLESTNKKHFQLASEIVHKCLPKSGDSIRIGITGVPGVGKSTFIEAFGSLLTKQGIKTAVLAIDPSSNINKGSILGDKTRMNELSIDPLAFVRPSPSSGSLGGVANATRESILLCEAAGFEVILVETVGVGQSEYLVNEMVDFFLLLMLSGAGDEIQGIKRGIMEMADALIVNKADGKNSILAQKAARAYGNALHLFPAREDDWIPQTGTCSAINHEGMDKVWAMVQKFQTEQNENNWFDKRRKKQSKMWLMDQVDFALKNQFFNHPSIVKNMDAISELVISGQLTPFAGSQKLMELYASEIHKTDVNL